jgi:hypothetical protein
MVVGSHLVLAEYVWCRIESHIQVPRRYATKIQDISVVLGSGIEE